jgi:(R)-amidase
MATMRARMAPRGLDSSMGISIKAELAQMALVDGDLEHNLGKVLEAIGRVDVAGGSQLIVFPEATLSGFPTRENIASIAQPLDGQALGIVREAARRAGVAVAVGLAERDGAKFYNTTVLIDAAGEITLRYRKTHLWSSDEGVFTPGDRFEVCHWSGLTVGLLICYDIEFPETARALARLGAQLLIVTNGNMDPYGPVHQRAIAARAMENQVFALMCNRCGRGHLQMSFPGQSALVDPSGEFLAVAAAHEIQLAVQLDPSRVESRRRRYQYLHEARVALKLRPVSSPRGTALLIE